MKKTLFILVTIVSLLSSRVGYSDEISMEEVTKMLRQLQDQILSQQQEIRELTERLDRSQNESLTDNEKPDQFKNTQGVDRIEDGSIESYAAIKEVVGVNLGKGIDGLTIKGDARFRYERQERNKAGVKDSRDRQRVRLRIGGVWANIEDNWEMAVGVALGGPGATSTNDNYSDEAVFETGNLRLDYAYARHSWERFDLIIGQQKNPFESTSIVWDGDVRPIGLTGKSSLDGGLFLTAGIYDVYHAGRDEANALLAAAQTGYSFKNEDTEMLIAAAYYHFNDATTDSQPAGAATDGNGIPASIDKGYDLRVGDIYSHIQMTAGEIKLKLYGHYARNFGADGIPGGGQRGGTIDPGDNDTACILGVEGKSGPFKLGVAYASIEADSVYGEIKDSDFGSTAGLTDTDVEGIKINAGYGFTKTCSLELIYMDLHEIDGPSLDGKLYQVDLKYKF